MERRPRQTPRPQPPGFEDIRSTTTGTQSRPDWFTEARPSASEAARRRQAERQAQRQSPKGRKPRTASTRPTSKSPPKSSRRPPKSSGASRSAPGPGRGRQPPRERQRRKPMSLFKRRLLMVLVMLVMLLGTGFLAESLLLRVTTVQVTGDQIYPDEEILKICGFKNGDNLLLLPTSDRERKLEAQLPYIAKAEITRRVPGTVNIEITAARGACSIQVGAEWCVVAAGGKVLELSAQPQTGLMQVLGLTVRSARPGEEIQLEGEETSEVFTELVGIIDRLGEDGQGASGEFTRMNLTNLYDIRLWYQERIECLLGSAAQLDYKLGYGYGLLTGYNLTDPEKGIGPEAAGVLDLSYLPTKKASYFREGETAPEVQPTASPDGTVPETGGTEPYISAEPTYGAAPEGGGTAEPTPTPAPERGGDIPDSPFTG